MRVHLFGFGLVTVLSLASSAAADTIVVKPGKAGETPLADAVAQLDDGDKLVIKKGVYPEQIAIVGKTGITIVGKGKVIIGDGSGLSSIVFTNCSNMSVSKLRVAPGDGTAVSLATSPSTTISKCRFVAGASPAIQILSRSDDVVIDKCRIDGTGLDATGHDGVNVNNSQNVTLSRNRFGGGLDDGVIIFTSSNGTTISKNRFDGVNDRAISGHAPDVLIDRNRFRGCTEAVETQRTVDAPGMVVSDNRMQDIGVGFGAISIWIGDVSVTGNKIKNIGGFGIVCRGNCIRITITGNKVESSAFAGIRVSGDDSEASDNKILNCPNTGLSVAATNGTYRNNTIKRSGEAGIEVEEGGNTFQENNVSGSATFDLLSGVPLAENTFVDNKFGTSDPAE